MSRMLKSKLMSDTHLPATAKKVPLWSWGLILIPLLALVGYTLFGTRSNSNSVDENGEYVFNPGPVKELEIKGVAADGTTSWDDLNVPASPPVDAALQARGRDVFAKACAACHADDGKGDGILVSRLNLNSRPANFTTPIASFKVRSTEKGTLPTDEDVFRTLTRGLPGTAMLSFRNLPEADRWALVHRVKEFWIGAKKWPAAKPLVIPAKLAKDDALFEEGRQQFGKWCANCHGTQAMGGSSFAFQMQRTFPAVIFARDGGKYMLRGSKPEDIVRTLMTGSSGVSPMMSFQPTFYGDEPNAHDLIEGTRKLWGTAYYARKLIEDQAK
jgi:mono/diheme cytochrome c family protein